MPRLIPLAVLVALAVAAAGCDTVPAGPQPLPQPTLELLPVLAELNVPLLHAPAGDFLYDLDPLPPGGTFRARLELAGGPSAELRSTGTGGGASLALVVDGLRPDSVTVSYLAAGTPVATPVTYGAGGGAARQSSDDPPPFEAGTADSGPDSYHYKEVNGEMVLVKDYVEEEAARSAGGTPFTTVLGERVRVTDVVFTLHGVGLDAPSAVRFTSPSAFVLRWFDLGD